MAHRALLLALLLLAGPVLAQSPSPGAAVSVTAAAESGVVSVEGPTVFSFTVRNEGSASGSPADANNTADVVVALKGAPVGWTFAVEPSAFRLAPQKEATVEVSVSVAIGSQITEATISLEATLSTPINRLDPILGNIPGAAQTATASASMVLQRDDSVTRGVLEALGPWIYVLMIAFVAAVSVVGYQYSVGRRVTVALLTTEKEASLRPGGRVALPMEVRNIGRADDTVVFQVSPLGDGWAAFLPVAELDLPRARSEKLHLVVIAPESAQPGERQSVAVMAASAQGPKNPASITFDVTVLAAAAKKIKR